MTTEMYTAEQVEKIALSAIRSYNAGAFSQSRWHADEILNWILGTVDTEQWEKFPKCVQTFIIEANNGILANVRPNEDEIDAANNWDGD